MRRGGAAHRKAFDVNTEVEEEIKTGLQGNEQKQYEAVCKAFDRYAAPLAAYILESVVQTLDSHALTTAVNDVFLELAKMAKQGKFKPDGSLASLLFKMARCNAIDQLRGKIRYERRYETTDFSNSENGNQSECLSDDEVASRVALKLADAPEVASAWRSITSRTTPAGESAAGEVVRLFKVHIASLPSFQRTVAGILAIHYGDITEEEICEEIGKFGKTPPLGSVKSARREIREKFTSLINQLERTEKP